MRKLAVLWTGLLLLCMHTANAQKQVTGKVTDGKNGSPLSGVSVKVKGSSTGTATAADGTYTITIPKGLSSLIFSFIGFQDEELEVKGNYASIALGERTNNLNEVVVVGYGTTVKRDLASSVVKVKGSDVANTPVPNFNQALQGRAAGVFVEANNGKVGEGVKVRIRGQGSVNASNAPLYVVDGLPVNTGSLSGNALADINFNDVESFEVLKDAAATAIYGSRAANGVIIITTKKGKLGKPKFNVGVQYGSNKPTNKREFLNATEYVELFTEAAENSAKYNFNRAGNPYGYFDEQEAIDEVVGFVEGRFTRYSGHSDWTTLETNTDWQDQAFQDARVGSINASASGGSERTKYYVSGSYDNQDGILVGNNFDRLSGRVNLDQELSSKLKMGINMVLSSTKARRVPEDNEFSTPMQIVALSPLTPVRDTTGKLYDRPTATYYNPLIDVENAQFKSYTFRTIGNTYAQYNFTSNLFLRSEYGIDVQNQNDEEYYGTTTINGQGTNGFGRSTWLRNLRQNSNTYLNYRLELGDNHKIDATAGYAFEKGTARSTQVTGEQFASDALTTLANAGKITGGTSTLNEYALSSFFGRVNYKFKDRYLLGVSARQDGSSVFGIDKRYGFFPAVSAGWIISDEGFLKNAAKLSFLKLRASYGQLGNSLGFGNYSPQAAYVVGRYAGVSVLTPGRLGNTSFTWETSNQADIGLEFGFFKNRISGEIDVYQKRSAGDGKGFIFNLPVPATSGYTSYIANVGEIENKGLEISLNTVNFSTPKFQWSTNFNISFNKNKVLKIDGDQDTLSFNDGRYMNALIVGQSIGIHYGQKFAGVDPQNGDALFYRQDGKSTTSDYNEAGQFVVGDPNAKYFAGLTNTFSFKGIELSVLLQGVFDYDIVNGAAGYMSARADWFDNQTRDQLGRWQKPGDITNIPEARLNYYGDFSSPAVSTQYMEDGTYVRVKNVTLSYNLSPTMLNKFKLSSAKFYATAINLATITNYSGWDPEVNTDYRATNINQGGDFYAAPQIKSVVVGLNIGF
ncbi:MAG: TonB-dependent receptor [Bacteroidota bacterium]